MSFSLLNLPLLKNSAIKRQKNCRRDLIKKEAYLGGQIFGPTVDNQQREFFCLDENTWIWYEAWVNPNTKERLSRILRYSIKEGVIYKKQDNMAKSQKLAAKEALNLKKAIYIYRREVLPQIYPHEDWS